MNARSLVWLLVLGALSGCGSLPGNSPEAAARTTDFLGS
jgi:hypothetical protein